MNKSLSSFFSESDLEYSSRGQFTDHIVLLLEALHQLLQYIVIECNVDFVSLMEVFIDLHENLGSQHVVFAS